jgi:hypothetical protein
MIITREYVRKSKKYQKVRLPITITEIQKENQANLNKENLKENQEDLPPEVIEEIIKENLVGLLGKENQIIKDIQEDPQVITKIEMKSESTAGHPVSTEIEIGSSFKRITHLLKILLKNIMTTGYNSLPIQKLIKKSFMIFHSNLKSRLKRIKFKNHVMETFKTTFKYKISI